MDPNELLNDIRNLMGEEQELDGVFLNRDRTRGLLSDLAARMDDLDEWLTKGGFLPDDWARGRPTR